jgi:tetratricopeptide (TPR) repeat protein
METMVYKTVSSAADIMRKLDQSRKHLRSGNLFSCISTFHDALQAYINIKNIIESDRVKVIGALNDFQQQIAASRQFKDLYGAFSFRNNDFTTSLEFITELIKIKEDEIADVLVNKEVNEILSQANLSKEDQEITKMMVSLVERGEQLALREMVAENDALASLVLAYYNDTGISYRAAGDIDKAIIEYKKAISISPDDEHLYYNVARAYLEKGKKEDAEECIGLAVKINPEFREGLKLQQYIRQWEP